MNYRKTILLICISIFLSSQRKANAQADTFHYVFDAIQTWTVPGCVTQVTVKLWAGGGGSGNWYGFSAFDFAGGSGSYYEGVLSGLTQGTTFDLYVPSGGKYTTYGPGGVGGWPGGGQGGYDTFELNGFIGGGGGGFAAIKIAGTYFVVTGAGGGAGSIAIWNCYGGSGGATNGGNGGSGAYFGGNGGTISSGGTPGYSLHPCDTATSGSVFTGGSGGGLPPLCDTSSGGGGGGAGYYGGGGGGGGSSFPSSIFTSGGITFTPISNLQGNAGPILADYPAPGSPPDSTIGIGGYGKNGGNGLIIIIGAYPSLTCTISGEINPTACGFCNGSATVTANNGRPPYTYSWAPTGQTTPTATGLCTGSYTVTVSDTCGNTATASVTLTAPPIAVATNITAAIKCHGDCNASATETIGLSTPPYTYHWMPGGQTNATATGLCAGNYTVTVTDKNGCTGTASVSITQPTQVTARIGTLSYPVCYGGGGTASVIASGGVSTYTYLWNPGNQTTANATGLSAGVYTVTVTDSNGCAATAGATITQPVAVTATITVSSPILCNGGTGSATVTAGNGISPYTYLWTGGQTNATATGLLAGTYTVNVTDHNGCTASAAITITQPALLTATMGIVNNVLCKGGTGSATVIPGGGTPAYTYSWSPSGGSNAMGTGMTAGAYTVTVTDKNNCTATASVTITQPAAALTASVTATTNISCYNGDNGSATVTALGGTSPYTYLWAPSGITSATANNLFALSYTITITDAHGCTATATTTLTQPAALTASINEPKLICKDSTGTLISNAGGGTAPYTYHWSTGATGNAASVTPIASNYYSVTVTDAHGCTATANITLKYGPDFAVAVSGKNSVCAGDSTTICAHAIGALDGAYYTWEPQNNTNACITVAPGLSSVYTVNVVDGCGSTTSTTTEIATVPSPDIKMSVNINQGCYPLCVQFRNATTISQGGIGQYVWTFGNGDTSHAQNPIYCYRASGLYSISLTATSDSGCSTTLSNIGMISVYAHPDAAFTYSPQAPTVETPTIQFSDESSDASGIIYRKWSFGDETDSTSSKINPSHTYLDTGSFCPNLIVMDSHGCTDTTTNCLVIGPAYKLYIPSAFSPNGDGLNEVFEAKGIYIKTFTMYIFDRWGQQIFETSDINQGWNGKVNGSGSLCQEDTYIYKINVTDSRGNQHSYVGNVTLLK